VIKDGILMRWEGREGVRGRWGEGRGIESDVGRRRRRRVRRRR